MNESGDRLSRLWQRGYSIAELWGFTSPITRDTSFVEAPHRLLWGILRLAEDQIDKGAGHKYLRERIATGEWIGIGFVDGLPEDAPLVIVPQLKEAKFGRQRSAVGDGTSTYVDVRFIHRDLWERGSLT